MEIGHLVSNYLSERDLDLCLECSNDILVDDKGCSLCLANLIINRIEGNLNFHVNLVKDSHKESVCPIHVHCNGAIIKTYKFGGIRISHQGDTLLVSC